jgi:hypothetical protein
MSVQMDSKTGLKITLNMIASQSSRESRVSLVFFPTASTYQINRALSLSSLVIIHLTLTLRTVELK